MPLRASNAIEVRWTRHRGRGVFAREFIAEGTVFETVPVLVVPEDEVLGPLTAGMLADYVFEWGKGTVGLALGFGSLYNHSYQPNARYDDEGRQSKVFSAVRDIHAGEEITINYNGEVEDRTPVGFSVHEESPTGEVNSTQRRTPVLASSLTD